MSAKTESFKQLDRVTRARTLLTSQLLLRVYAGPTGASSPIGITVGTTTHEDGTLKRLIRINSRNTIHIRQACILSWYEIKCRFIHIVYVEYLCSYAQSLTSVTYFDMCTTRNYSRWHTLMFVVYILLYTGAYKAYHSLRLHVS